MKALPIIVCERRIIERMVGREPALRPAQREDAGLYMGLSDACKH